jgi:transposase
MKQFLVVGVDISKATLDICFKPCGTVMHINNNLLGFKGWHQELKTWLQPETTVMVVMEHTGGYSARFESFLRSKCIDYCKIAALQIKRSLGMTRGKNDRVDAQRIAEYGWLRREILRADEPCLEGIARLRQLLSLRSKLVRDRSGYTCRVKEMKATADYNKKDPLLHIQEKLIATFTLNIKMVEKQIDELINEHDVLKRTSELLRSIKGVGKVIAAYMISCTNNFKRFVNPRKFNCYAGLAPFKKESGTSIKGRAGVSHLANKEAKALLNLAACCAIRSDQELKQYFQKRVAEGKRKMSCLNIIRSKLVARMFAVVKRQSPYQELLIAA